VWAQADIFAPMKDAVKAGSAKELAKYFNQSVDINLEGEVNTYSKAQGEFVMRDFFKKFPVSDFTIEHTGSSKSGLQYAIGNFKSASDQFNVLMRVKQSGSTLPDPRNQFCERSNAAGLPIRPGNSGFYQTGVNAKISERVITLPWAQSRSQKNAPLTF
jgi:hypothetical protein